MTAFAGDVAAHSRRWLAIFPLAPCRVALRFLERIRVFDNDDLQPKRGQHVPTNSAKASDRSWAQQFADVPIGPATSSATSKGISSSAQRRRKASTSSPYSRTTARRRGSVKWWLPQITKSRRFTTQPYVPQYGTPFQLGCCGRSAASVSCAGVSKCRPAVSAFGQTGH